MAMFDKNEGRYKKGYATSDELWSALLGVFTPTSRKTTTYKFGFLKSIIDNLYNVDINYVLTFDQLFGKFTEIYWNLILKYNLLQKPVDKNNKESKIEKILYSTQSKYSLGENIPFESLPEQIKQEIVVSVKKECKQYVVAALFGDTQMMFYSFSKSEEWIQINPQMYDFICKHKLMIEKINYFEWAKSEKIVAKGILDKDLEPVNGKARYISIGGKKKRMPLLLSQKGYGISVSAEDMAYFCGVGMHGQYICTENEKQIDYYVLFGGNTEENLGLYKLLESHV